MRKKIVSPGHRTELALTVVAAGVLLRAGGLPYPAVGALHLLVSGSSTRDGPAASAAAVAGVVGRISALWVSADRGVVASGRLAGGQATDPTSPGVRKVCAFPRAGESLFGVGFRRGCRRKPCIVGMCGRGTSLRMPPCAEASYGCWGFCRNRRA